MKITILDGRALNPGDLSWDCFKQFGSVTYYDRTEGEALTVERIGNSDIVLLNKVPVTENILDQCPNLKLICVLATGYNVVDCKAAAARGIPVCNVPGYGTDPCFGLNNDKNQSDQPVPMYTPTPRSWTNRPFRAS